MRMIQGSVEPQLRVTLSDNGEPIDLTDAEEVQLRGELMGQIAFQRAGSKGDRGLVTMDWLEGDTDVPGRIWLAARVRWPGARVEWFAVSEVVDVDAL
jgi:hypothetical protein